MEEVKAGAETAASAKRQQQAGLDALARIAAGDPDIRLHHRRRTDITDAVDAGTVDATKAKTTGPNNRGYDIRLDISQSELSQIIRDILKKEIGQ